MYIEGVECPCVGRGREKGWSVHAWGEGGCVYMEVVGYMCSERERMCIREGLIVCMYVEGVDCRGVPREREDVCIWKVWSVCARGEDVCEWKGWCVRSWGEG